MAAELPDITSTTRYNLHSHTQFCDGRATVVDFAEAAFESGLLHYGFSPHSPLPKHIESNCNMSMADVPVYLEQVDFVKNRYKGKNITFYKGMEIDYISKDWGPSTGYFKDLGLDYSIGSVHFIPDKRGEYIDVDGRPESFMRKMALYFHNDIDYVVKKFYEQTHEMIELGGFEIIGHFDKIGQNGSHYMSNLEQETWYVDLVQEVIDHLARTNVYVEINTKSFMRDGRYFPNQKWWDVLIDKNMPVLVNSDAHYPDLINASREYPLEWFDSRKGKK